MSKYSTIPDLLEQFMDEQDADERWVTVQELRDYFSLTRYQCNTISGFLRRLRSGRFRTFQFIVVKIEQLDGANPSDPKTCRYLVRRKQAPVPLLKKSQNNPVA